MKKIFFLTFLLLFISGVCFASNEKLLSNPNNGKNFMSSFNNKIKLSSDDISKKENLMKKNVLAFYRACPHLFYSDIFSYYKDSAKLLPNPPSVTINGDIHIGNFGTLKLSKNQVAWGMNDFDLACTGSPEWDLERYAVSLILQAKEMKLSEEQQKELVTEFSDIYFDTSIKIYKEKKTTVPYLTENNSSGSINKLIKKSKAKKQLDFLEKYAELKYLDYKFNDKELIPITPQLTDTICSLLKRNFKDIKKIYCVSEKKDSGGSTYGLKRYWALVSTERLPIILELKQILPNPTIDLTGDLAKADGKLILNAQKELGGIRNRFSSYTSIDGYSYIIREREAASGDVSLKKLDYEELKELNHQCAIVIAYAHCYEQKNCKALANWLKDKQMLSSKLYKFSCLYANQTEIYFNNF